MDIQEQINLGLHQLFTTEGIQALSPRPLLCQSVEPVR
jgi:hypothetical protein